VEEDGEGDMPAQYRSLLLDRQGSWGIYIGEMTDQFANILKVLRKALNRSIDELMQIKSRIPGILLTGTRYEMIRLQNMLAQEGLASSVVRLV